MLDVWRVFLSELGLGLDVGRGGAGGSKQIPFSRMPCNVRGRTIMGACQGKCNSDNHLRGQGLGGLGMITGFGVSGRGL